MTLSRISLLALASALALPLAAAAAGVPTIKATRLSAEQVKLGAPFTAEVIIDAGAHGQWHAGALPADSPFALLGQSEADGKDQAVVTLRLGLYALGAHALPDIPLVGKSGARLVVPGEAKITGSPSLAKGDTELRALAGPRVPLVLDKLRVFLAAGASLLALGLLALALVAIRRRFREGASQERRDRRTLEALLRGQSSDLEFYLVLDGIVRRHLERRHNIPAQERTAAELSALVTQVPTLPAAELARLFGEANLVKFAARAAQPGQRAADHLLAARLLAEPPKTQKSRGSHAASPVS